MDTRFKNLEETFLRKQFWSKKCDNTEKSPFLIDLCHRSFLIRNNLNFRNVQSNCYTILFRIKFYIWWHNNKSFTEQVWALKKWLSNVHSKMPTGVSSKPFSPEQQHPESRKGRRSIEHKFLYLLVSNNLLLASALMRKGLQ